MGILHEDDETLKWHMVSDIRREMMQAERLAPVLDKIMDARFQTPFATLASLSLCCESIAQNLSDAQHIQAGAEPRKLSEQLPAQSAHFRHLAEQAITSLDPGRYDASIEHAVAEMVNGQFTRHMSVEETARETLSIFLAHLARPIVDEPAPIWPSGKCRACGGILEQRGLTFECDSCGHTFTKGGGK